MAKSLIHSSLDLYLDWFDECVKQPRELIHDKARGLLEAIHAYDSHIGEEIEGIASGSEVTPEDIVFLNARTELVCALIPVKDPSGCTTIGLCPPASREGDTFVGQNWDWIPPAGNNLVCLVIKDTPDSPDAVIVTEAGMVGKMGLNECGLGIGVNFLAGGPLDVGAPFHAIARGVLKAETLPDAIKAVTTGPRAYSGNYLIGHADGEVVDVETSQDDIRVVEPEEGIVTHTNHFRWIPMGGRDMQLVYFPDTAVRSMRIEKSMRRKKGILDADTIKASFADHFGYPDSVCRHVNPREPVVFRRCETLFSIIMNLTRKEIHISLEHPCKGAFREFSFEEILSSEDETL